jgi:hypothetical protein
MLLLDHMVTMKTASIAICGNYKDFLFEHVVAMDCFMGTCGNYKAFLYWSMW